jgi:ribonuclease HII
MSQLAKFKNEDCLEVGIDEAGRGPLFGRVYVGAAILPPDESYNHSLMRDSKKLSPRKRLIAFDYIKEHAIDWATYYHEPVVIDEKNIFHATYDAMHKCLDKLKVIPEHILVDGNHFPIYYRHDYIPFTCVIKGDNLYTSIAAASILAKVAHDKYIEKLCDENDDLDNFYGLRSNKGYGTKQHMDGIEIHGITQWHRKSFAPCRGK